MGTADLPHLECGSLKGASPFMPTNYELIFIGVISSMSDTKKEQPLNIVERKLGNHKAAGLYWSSSDKIEIDPRLDSRQYLYVLTHELLHKALPDCSEEEIIRISELVSKGIWQQDFRRIKT